MASDLAPPSAFTDTIPGTLISFNMVPVPPGSVTVRTPDGRKRVWVDAFRMGRTEVTWEAFDVFVYGLDEEGGETQAMPGGVDALSRPSEPYMLPGADFGHSGYPALAMTQKGAAQYARWLSVATGKKYRLPTRAEWTRACRAGTQGASNLGDYAWYAANSEDQTHPVASLDSNALDMYDLRGNVAEYVAAWSTEGDNPPVVRGGSYRDDAGDVGCTAYKQQTSAWNASDPQMPKSEWWLADAPFVGFRLVHDADSTG